MITDLYPFSTKEATAIPLDVLRPLSTVRKAFVDGVAGSSLDLGVADTVLLLKSTASCLIGFGVTPTAMVDGVTQANVMILSPDEIITVAPVSPILTLMGDGADGVLTVLRIARWAGIGLETQFQLA